MSTRTQARPLFAATLTPHRSLSRRGFRVVVALIAVLAGIPGMVFFSLGAWPIVGFLGLDVLLIWWALGTSMTSGKRYEEVTLWPDQLELRQVSARGGEQVLRLNPFVVKLVIDRDFNERTTALRLRTRERDIEIGAFLNPDDKASFAKVFGTALRKARG
ncbi:MAG: DUF2244 domain-containing protein [Devosia sp.]|nr:DUF2244 domain-containing protein [Devosia sp.]